MMLLRSELSKLQILAINLNLKSKIDRLLTILPIRCVILEPTYKERAFCSALFEIKSHLGNKEVMPMIESSIRMGHQVTANRLCAGAVL